MVQLDANWIKRWSGARPSQSSGGSVVEEASCRFNRSSFFNSIGIPIESAPFSTLTSSSWRMYKQRNYDRANSKRFKVKRLISERKKTKNVVTC